MIRFSMTELMCVRGVCEVELLIILTIVFVACLFVAYCQWVDIKHCKNELKSSLSYMYEKHYNKEIAASMRLLTAFFLIALAMLVPIILVII